MCVCTLPCPVTQSVLFSKWSHTLQVFISLLFLNMGLRGLPHVFIRPKASRISEAKLT